MKLENRMVKFLLLRSFVAILSRLYPNFKFCLYYCWVCKLFFSKLRLKIFSIGKFLECEIQDCNCRKILNIYIAIRLLLHSHVIIISFSFLINNTWYCNYKLKHPTELGKLNGKYFSILDSTFESLSKLIHPKTITGNILKFCYQYRTFLSFW